MNAQALITITYPDLSQNKYLIEDHEDLLDAYRLLDEINKKQNAALHVKLQRGTGATRTL